MTDPSPEEMPALPLDPTRTAIPHPDGAKTTGDVPLLRRVKHKLWHGKQSTETGE